MRWILLLGIFSLLTPARAGHTPPPIILRVHVQTSGEGLPSTQATQVALPPNGEVIQIRSLAEAGEHDLLQVTTDQAGALHLQFNHRAQVNLNAATGSQNNGRILVVLLNGQVLYAPVIDEQITTGELVIPHPVSPDLLKLLEEIAADNLREQNRT